MDGRVELLVQFGLEIVEAVGKDALAVMAGTLVSWQIKPDKELYLLHSPVQYRGKDVRNGEVDSI